VTPPPIRSAARQRPAIAQGGNPPLPVGAITAAGVTCRRFFFGAVVVVVPVVVCAVVAGAVVVV
jgi:hypothetical protein